MLSVFGPFGSRALIEMPANVAKEMFGADLPAASRSAVVEAAERDIEAIRSRSPELADSALAASAVAMAYEMENPYNSATSKSMCAKALLEALEQLRDLCPPAEEGDALDELASRRAVRRGGGAAT